MKHNVPLLLVFILQLLCIVVLLNKLAQPTYAQHTADVAYADSNYYSCSHGGSSGSSGSSGCTPGPPVCGDQFGVWVNGVFWPASPPCAEGWVHCGDGCGGWCEDRNPPPPPPTGPPPPPQYTISGTVFNDLNADGVQNPGEYGLIAETVTETPLLVSGSASTLTNNLGQYSFLLDPNTYSVMLTLQPTYIATTPTTVFVNLTGNTVVNFGVQTLPAPPSPTPVSALPDLITHSLNSSRSSPTPGMSVSFYGFVRNQGGSLAAASYARFCIDNVNCLTSGVGGVGTDRPVGSLAALTNSPLITTSTSWTATSGPHTVHFCADVTGVVSEFSEANNCSFLNFTVAAPTPTPTPTPIPIPGWLQTFNGDVHSGGDISMTIDAQKLVPPQFNATWVVTSGGSITNFSSQNNWVIQPNYIATTQRYDYDYFNNRLTPQDSFATFGGDCSSMNTNNVYRITGNAIITGVTVDNNCANKNLVIFVDGDLYINANFDPTPGAIAFIVKGNIFFAPTVTNARGIFLANGRISTGR